jgi:hypothetical protein
LAEGTQSVQVRQTDVVGNVSTANTFTFTLDKTVAAPSVALANDTGTSNTDKKTFDPTLSVTGETGAQVQFSIDGGTTWLNAMPALTDGDKAIKVRQTDVAGNVSAITDYTFTLDRTGQPLTLNLVNDTAVAGNVATQTDKITSDATLNINGLEAGSSWQYSTNGGATWSAANLTSAGTTFSLTGDGVKTVVVRQTDLSGNVSEVSSAFTFTRDTTTATPTLSLASDTGQSATDKITNVGVVNVMECRHRHHLHRGKFWR